MSQPYLSIIFVLLAASVAPACRTTGPVASAEHSEMLSVDHGPEKAGYFVSVSARSTLPEAVAFYDKLYDAIDVYNRKKARDAGELTAYVEEFEATGQTSLVGGDDEIECDREKCLLKLTGRVVTASKEAQATSFAAQMVAALDGIGIAPVTNGAGESILKTYTLGDLSRLGLTCSQKGFGAAAIFACRFNLDGSGAGSVEATGTRGKLANCTLSPGVVKGAEEAKSNLDGGLLVKLTAGASPGTSPVGYLLLSRQNKVIDFSDIFLCGDVSHDTFYLTGSAKTPSGWIAKSATIGGKTALDPAHQDDVEMRLVATIVEKTARFYTLDVAFKLVPEGKIPTEVYGDDRFFVRIEADWTR